MAPLILLFKLPKFNSPAPAWYVWDLEPGVSMIAFFSVYLLLPPVSFPTLIYSLSPHPLRKNGVLSFSGDSERFYLRNFVALVVPMDFLSPHPS